MGAMEQPNPGAAAAFLSLCTIYVTFPLCNIAGSLALTAAGLTCAGKRVRAALLAYLAWVWFVDDSPQRGGYRWCWVTGVTRFLRQGFWWRWSASYMPVTLHPTVALPPSDGPYIFVCHPHGIFGISPMTHFGTDASNFSKLFPGVFVHLLGHSAIFRLPFFREWCLAHGCGTVDKRTCLTCLKRGRSIAIAPGGAKESLECKRNTMRLVLENRKGFAKLALQTGAALVPVLGFGENELYRTVQFEPGSWSRWLQEALQKRLGFALPVFCGRSWAPLLPRKVPVSTVVGAPLRPKAHPPSPGGSPGEPSAEDVNAFHKEYCAALESLFEEHKARFGAEEMRLELV